MKQHKKQLSLGSSHVSDRTSSPVATMDMPLSLRAATMADLDDITKVAQAGFPDDPEWNYRFPYREEYPKDNWKWTRREYEEYLAQPDKYAVILVTALVEKEGQFMQKTAAIAVWDMSVLTQPASGGKFLALVQPWPTGDRMFGLFHSHRRIQMFSDFCRRFRYS